MPSRICEGAIPTTIAVDEANASQRAVLSVNDSVASMQQFIIPKRAASGFIQ
jgi:hypothetical protein